jgi:hypothetical protein
VELLQLGAHVHAQLGVEVRERLVEEEDVRLADERARERDPLTLPARQLVRPALEKVPTAHDLRRGFDPRPRLRTRDTSRPQAEADVLGDGEMREEGVALEDHRDVAVGRRNIGHVAPADVDRALGDILETRGDAQSAALPRAGRPDEHEQLLGRHLEVEAAKRPDGPVVLPDAREPQSCH